MFLLAPIAAVVGLLAAFFFFRSMLKASSGNEVMQSIAGSVREGAFAYLFRQYRLVSLTFAVLFIVLIGLAVAGVQNPFVPFAFLSGGLASGLAGFIGMNTATHASARTAQASSEGLNRGLRVAFTSGAVMGLCVVGLGLLDISIWYLLLSQVFFTPEHLRDGMEVAGMTLVEQLGPHCFDGDTLNQAGERLRLNLIASTMVTFGIGASLQALFARVGGGIYTKAADVGADLVGKVEAGIPEDDPRNPATIADNVGDNVGDVAGMGADLYESYFGSIVATAALGSTLPLWFTEGNQMSMLDCVTAPMAVAGIGVFCSVLGTFLVRTKEGASQATLLRSLLIATSGAGLLILAAAAGLAVAGLITWGLFGSIVAGLVTGIVVGQLTEYYTSNESAPTKGIADQARMGPAPTIIDGVAVGLLSTGWPVLVVVLGILASFGFAGGFGDQPGALAVGLYGVSLAAVGMLSTLGITLATDAYGPIADNAGGNAEMAGLPSEVRERTDALDALGNTTAATGKGFAIGSAALTALALLASYVQMIPWWLARSIDPAAGFIRKGEVFFYQSAEGLRNAQQAASSGPGSSYVPISQADLGTLVQAYELNLLNPLLMAGLFLGAAAAFVFTALTMKAVGRAAGAMVEEVRRQFRDNPGIMHYNPGDDSEENKQRMPDYGRCVAIATTGAQKEMLVPALLGILIPIATGLVLGVAGVIGLLTGALAAGFPLATFLNNAGGAWDNAKKAIESGMHGGKYLQNDAGDYVDAAGNKVDNREDAKNPVHAATVIGDTVGDPFKDTSGPSLNILIKLMAVVSVVFSGLVVTYSWL